MANRPRDHVRDGVYTQALSYFNALRRLRSSRPVTTTGPTAIGRRTAGYNSLERLDQERQLFFSTPYTLGQHRMRQEVQTRRCVWE